MIMILVTVVEVRLLCGQKMVEPVGNVLWGCHTIITLKNHFSCEVRHYCQ